MKSLLRLLALVTLTLAATAAEPVPDTKCYELRTYHAAPGKLDALHARFRDHTMKLFARHGMTNLGYFVPLENKENKLVYFLSYPSRAARDEAWKAFGADPEWKTARDASEKDGKLVAKVDSVFLHAADFSPTLKIDAAEPARTFELRTYTTEPGRLDALKARFRDHTVKLFEKHGMTNVIYWLRDEDQPQADVTLVYLLAHKSPEAAAASFKAFREDPAWTAARTASEKAAGGSLTVKDGVKSEMLAPVDYSPIK